MKRPEHEHACLTCDKRWKCRNRCKGNLDRVCWECLSRAIKRQEEAGDISSPSVRSHGELD